MFKFKKSKEVLQIVEEKTPEIEIIIDTEGEKPIFEQEDEQIKIGAKIVLENNRAENMEDAIITFACMFRGLTYKGTEHTEDGRTIITFKDTAYQKTLHQ